MKKLEPCKEFLPGWNYYLVWNPNLCYDCEWLESEHTPLYSCEDCVCTDSTGEIYGPCAYHKSLWHKCVQIAQCDCVCHVKPKARTGNARINLRPTKRRRPLVLPPAPKVVGHEDYYR